MAGQNDVREIVFAEIIDDRLDGLGEACTLRRSASATDTSISFSSVQERHLSSALSKAVWTAPPPTFAIRVNSIGPSAPSLSIGPSPISLSLFTSLQESVRMHADSLALQPLSYRKTAGFTCVTPVGTAAACTSGSSIDLAESAASRLIGKQSFLVRERVHVANIDAQAFCSRQHLRQTRAQALAQFQLLLWGTSLQ